MYISDHLKNQVPAFVRKIYANPPWSPSTSLSLSIYTHLGVDYSPPPAGLRVNFPEGTLGTSLVGLKADVRLAVQGTTYA